MAEAQWQKVKAVFYEALSQAPAERLNFVRQVCGADQTLQTEVESLLDSLDVAESFMETPAAVEMPDFPEAAANPFETGKRFGHYEIIKQIGIGGMGRVYLAQDEKLDRRVAVKILNEKFSRHESNLPRFIREAKSASSLNHPNILVIHEIGETDESHFIVSEFIEGKTLREILREKNLEIKEILDVAVQTAKAPSAAHNARLIHRDIKPENIMVRPDGFVKILDFGLAKLVEPKSGVFEESNFKSNDTAKGVIMGTINYMSPEQAKGRKVDERTDIFSLGAVIYEMITGQTPFAGDSVLESLANLINSEPPPLARFTANVPDKLQKIVAETLCKNADRRYQTMEKLLADLKDLRENLTFEEKLERRGSIPAAADWKTGEPSEDDLIDLEAAESGNAYQAYQLSRYYFQKVSVPDLIKSRVQLEKAVRFDADFAPAHAALAEQAVMEVIIGLKSPAENFPKAKKALRRAEELNPTSVVYYAAAGFVALFCNRNFSEAKRNLRKVLELNPNHAFANKYSGESLMYQCRMDEAEIYLRRAIEIEPMDFHHQIVFLIYTFLTRNYQKLIEECEKLLAVYPQLIIAGWMRCWGLAQTGRAAEAVAEYKKILQQPGGELVWRWIGYAYALIDEREKALEVAACLEAESREHYLSPTYQALIYTALKEHDNAFSYLEKSLADRDPWILWTAADPRFDNLRLDPRFDKLVRRIGLK